MAELLAPVGSKDKLKAAVYSGADAVYLGLKKFNARNNAENFGIDDIYNAIEFCHSFGVKVYVTLNTLVTDIELKEIEKLLKILSNLAADAVIVQDLGVLDLIRQTQSDLLIHASTQMNIHSVQGANLLKSLGVSRVVLSREMTLDEIEEVCKTGIEVEVFVHGALCYCVSGQCLLSSMLGARSANRGVCAQPCRLPFSFSKPPKPDLSLKDLCAIDMIDKLKNVGVHSFKIEGRMKRPEYVAAATAAYRNVLDGKKPDINSLFSVFSRSGFTNGYIKNHRGRHMFGIRTKDDMAPEGLYAKIREKYRRPFHRFKVNAHITIKRGQRVKLKFKDGENESVVFGEIPQQAKGLGIDKQTIKNKIAKLGATPYYLNEFEIIADDGLYIPLSSLNELRRKAISKLTMIRMESWKKISPAKFNDSLTFGMQVKNKNSKACDGKIKLRIECEKFEQIVFSDNLQLI
ncbi:MAG: U32 family peptidase, partial [Oscillospiraceae bacterium]|nr:U32 family peptidase [Oscillospiraceae bacterium]